MTVTWHWIKFKDQKFQVHARRAGAAEALCGAASQDRPVMRPPFLEIRCERCEELRAGEEEAFPNHMKS